MLPALLRTVVHTTGGAVVLAVLACLGCIPPLGFPPPSDVELIFNVGSPAAPIDVSGEALFDSEAIFASIPGKAGSHTPTICALPDGKLLAAWYSYTGPHELDGSAIYMSCRPADDEPAGNIGVSPVRSWKLPWLHIDRPHGDGNPVLYAEGDQVWLFQAVVPGGWSTAHIEVQRSADRGQNWSSPRVIDGPLGANVRFPPVRTAGGTLLLPAYDDLWQRSLFFTSADGDSWSLTSAVCTAGPHSNLQPSLALLDDGRLLAVMRNGGGDWLWVMASDDQGRSWSPPQDSGFANPGSPAALLSLHSGNLALIFNDDRRRRTPLSISLSSDGGLTWSPPRVLVDGDGAYAYPAAVQTPDGLIHVVYSHDRERIQHIRLNEAWIVRSGTGSQ